MKFFDRFRREQGITISDEADQYNRSQRRERVVAAIILGIIASVVTLIIASVLFFAGRFVYRAIKGDKQPTQTQVTAPIKEQKSTNVTTPETPAAPSQSPPMSPNTGDGQALPRTGDEGL